jgi:hypothetical protein
MTWRASDAVVTASVDVITTTSLTNNSMTCIYAILNLTKKFELELDDLIIFM